MSIAVIIRIHRKMADLTQKELAMKVGVHPQIISNVERGVMRLPLKHSRKLRKALSITEKQWQRALTRDYVERVRAI